MVGETGELHGTFKGKESWALEIKVLEGDKDEGILLVERSCIGSEFRPMP